jgi:DNA-binding NarL/FixJ family response regulator
MAARLMDGAAKNGHAKTANGMPLTVCERHVLQMVAESLTTKEIAERLGMSPKTVEHHRASLMRKVGVRDVAGLTRFAVKAGVLAEE